MPMLMTDVAKGAQAAEDIQKAGLMTAYNPVHVDEMIKQAPLETQKLQQSLQVNEAALKRTQLDSAILLQTTMEKKQAKDTVQQLLQDPKIQALPEGEQQQAIGRALSSAGLLEEGRKFYETGERTQLHQQTVRVNQLKLDADKAEDIRRILSNMADDGSDVEQAFLELNTKAHALPEELAMIRGTITGAQKAGLSFKDIKTKLVAGAGSYIGDVARAKAVHDAAVLAEKVQYDRNKAEEDKRQHEQRIAAILGRGSKSSEAMDLRKEIEDGKKEDRAAARELLEITRKNERNDKQRARLGSEISRLSEEENLLTDNAETKAKDLAAVEKEIGSVPRDPATMKMWGMSTATDKDKSDWTRWKRAKDAYDAANSDTDPKNPSSQVAKIRARMTTKRKELDSVGVEAEPANTTPQTFRAVTPEVATGLKDIPRTPEGDARITKLYGPDALEKIYGGNQQPTTAPAVATPASVKPAVVRPKQNLPAVDVDPMKIAITPKVPPMSLEETRAYRAQLEARAQVRAEQMDRRLAKTARERKEKEDQYTKGDAYFKGTHPTWKPH